MDKLIEMLGKLVQALLKAKTLWFIIVVVAVFSLLLLLLNGDASVSAEQDTSFLTKLKDFFNVSGFMGTYGQWIGPLALASMSLIVVKVVAELIGLLKDRFW